MMVRIRWRGWSGMRFLAVVAAIMLVIVLLFSTSPHTEDSHGHAREVDMVERIHVMIVMCNRNKDGTNKEEVRM